MITLTLNSNKLIRKNSSKEVINHGIDGIGGLFDPNIFGYTIDEKKSKMGYIDLKGHFIDMGVFKIAKRLFRDLPYIIDGSKKFKIGADGGLILDPDGETGLDWFYKNFNNIKFTKMEDNENNRLQTKKMKEAWMKLTREQFFMTKLMVLPQHYRDIDTTSGSIKIDTLNQMYMDLIKACSFKDKQKENTSMVTYFNDVKIQSLLSDIYEHISAVLQGTSKADGVLRDGAMGRSVDNGARIVIVAPEIKPNDTIGKTNFELDKISLPLHHIMNIAPVQTIGAVFKILNSFYENGLINQSREEFEMEFNEEVIKEKIKNYYHAYAERFEKVKYNKDQTIKLYFDFTDSDTEELTSELRDITWLDVFYLAVNLFKENIRSMAARYPITDKDSMIFCKINILVFNKDNGNMKIKLTEEDTDYIYDFDNYPNVHKYENNPVSYIFEETAKFSNLYLEGMGGDYDGDKVSIKSVYSKEAVAEIDNYNNEKPISLLKLNGNNSRNIGKEGFQALYNLTIIKKVVKATKESDNDVEEFLKLEDFKLKVVLNLLNKYDCDTIYKDTTIGRVVFNKVIFGHIKTHVFINDTITKGKMEDIINSYAAKLIENTLSMADYKFLLNKYHDLAFGITELVSASVSYNMLIKSDDVFNDKKTEIMDKYKDAIEAGDVQALYKYENEMVEFSKEYYKGDPMYDLYASGASPKWGVDFKSLKISLGAAPIPGTSDVAIITSNLKDGINNKDILPNTNMQISGAASRALLTAQAGYIVKRFASAAQSTFVYEGDCGTKKYKVMTHVKKGNLLFRYILDETGKEIMLTPEIADKYLNKPVSMRTPMFCESTDGICSHCAGEMMLNLTKSKRANAGFFVADMGSVMLNKFMKATHDMTQKTYTIKDLDEFLE